MCLCVVRVTPRVWLMVAAQIEELRSTDTLEDAMQACDTCAVRVELRLLSVYTRPTHQ